MPPPPSLMYILQHSLQRGIRKRVRTVLGCPDAGRAARLKWNPPTGNYPLPPGGANLEGAPYSGTELPPLLKARGVGLIPRGARAGSGSRPGAAEGGPLLKARGP